MPKLANTNMESHQIGGSNFKFSAIRIEDLGASEYTLGVIVVDVSGSVEPFKNEIEGALKEVVKACRRSPRADNMMLRVVLFDDKVSEVHGFRPLPDCNEADYDGVIPSGGMTALYDAAYSSIKSAIEYGKQLTAKDFNCNAAVFVITDGQDNRSKMTCEMVAKALKEAKSAEALESIMPVLIGVNTDDGNLDQYLTMFKHEAGFQQFVSIKKATEKELAKLGGFISKSISSQSQALGSGGSSQSLTF